MHKNQTQSVDAGLRSDAAALYFRNRRSDPVKTYFRGSRYFTVGHEWFGMLREGTHLGPFLEQGEAELAVAQHVAKSCLISPGGVARLFDHGETEATDFELMVREMLGCLEQCRLRSDNCAFVWTTQRIDFLRRHPAEQSCTQARIAALDYMLDQLER